MTKLRMWENPKTQIVTKLKNSKRDKVKNTKGKNSKTYNMTKIISKCDKTKKIKM